MLNQNGCFTDAMIKIKRISRYILLLIAVAFFLVPQSEPVQKITWQEVILNMLFGGMILDNLLIIIGVSRRKFQLYLELILYPSVAILFIIGLLKGASNFISALTSPEVREIGGPQIVILMAITFLIMNFLIFSCLVLAIIDAKNILLKFKNKALDK